MKLIDKTILITGGNSGIGYATAKLLSENNKVIITGRDAAKLEKAGAELGVETIVFDITKGEDIDQLVNHIKSAHSKLSVLINNAGSGKLYRLGEGSEAYNIAREEFETNYFGPLRLTEALLPLLSRQPQAAIVNVSSNVAIHPLLVLPTYSDSKAALHSHTQALRLALSRGTRIKVFEVFPSLIDTAGTRALGLTDGLPAEVAAEAAAEKRRDHMNVVGMQAKETRDSLPVAEHSLRGVVQRQLARRIPDGDSGMHLHRVVNLERSPVEIVDVKIRRASGLIDVPASQVGSLPA